MCVSAAIAMAVSTGISVIGQLQQGQAQKQAKDAQAAEYDLQAQQEKVAAEQEAKRIRAAGEKTAGAARTALAGSGIVVDSGSGVNINEDIYAKSESDAYNTLLTGSNRVNSYGRSASMARAAGNDAVSGSLMSAIGTAGSAFAGWKGTKGGALSSKDSIIPMQPGGGN